MMKFLRSLFRLGIGASQTVITGFRRPLGYQQLSAGTLASATALTIPAAVAALQPGYAMIQANGGTVRWRDDGTNPTASVGMLIPDGGELNYVGDISAIKFILSTSSPILDVSIYA